jgi:ribosomal protein L36
MLHLSTNFPLSRASLHHTAQPASKPALKQALPPLLPTSSVPPLRANSVKKISPSEMLIRREKRLCYFCDENFSFNHKCLNKQYMFLQSKEDDSGDPHQVSQEAEQH